MQRCRPSWLHNLFTTQVRGARSARGIVTPYPYKLFNPIRTRPGFQGPRTLQDSRFFKECSNREPSRGQGVNAKAGRGIAGKPRVYPHSLNCKGAQEQRQGRKTPGIVAIVGPDS